MRLDWGRGSCDNYLLMREALLVERLEEVGNVVGGKVMAYEGIGGANEFYVHFCVSQFFADRENEITELP